MNTPAVLALPPTIQQVATEHNISVDSVYGMWSAYAPHFDRFNELRDGAKDIPISAPNAARKLRLELKAIRVAAEKTRKELKEDSLRRGRVVDGINAILEMQLVPVEKAMDAIEKAEEIAEQKRRDALKAERFALLSPYADATFYDLGNMPAAQWDNLLMGAKAAHEARLAAAAKAEADRIATELAAAELREKQRQAEQDERDRMQAENTRLAKVAAEEKAKREESERVARLAAAENEAKASKEREAADAKAKQELGEAIEAVIIAEQKRQAAESELKAKQEAESKRLAAEKAAARKAAAAPDRQKLAAMAGAVRLIAVPSLTTEAGIALKAKIQEQVAKFASWLEAEAAKL